MLVLLLVWQANRSPQPAAADKPGEAVAKAAVAEPVSAPSEEPATVNAGTALQTVENVRLHERAESSAVVDKVVPAPPASEWQVVENHSRKLR